ncbi:protein phosphatase 1 regulatory subunit 42-like isoform X2 [Liolophura sinensis]|uniref:protein phosphatase 1 regulatory subunit 42-like isoform X2 n=1 Tax=Liolophura sinensis TaxID=3198878 RepID=UPI003158C896
MVKLTVDLIARGTSGYTKQKREETVHQYLRRLTHLYLENRGIDAIGDELGLCRNLTVLYLYDNQLTSMPLLTQNQNLTHLYLQNNNISHIENLSSLRRLTKLYLGYNKITVLEGLEKLEQLQELHVENQCLPCGEKLLLDPRSLKALSRSLQILNISSNGLESIKELEWLINLNQLMASDNNLNDMRELDHVLSQVKQMWRLDLMGNPLCHKAKYRDRVIIMSPSLEMLDGKEISKMSKQFLMNWQANRVAQRRKIETIGRRATLDEIPLHSTSKELPPTSAAADRRRLTSYIMPGLPRKEFDQVLARSVSVPNSSVLTKRHPGPHKAHSDSAPSRFPDISKSRFLSAPEGLNWL